jgi:energy-coupling factor transporter transmembrane protein EcfT
MQLRTLEELSENSSRVHSLHPLTKSWSTVLFLALVVSFPRYEIGALAPFAFFLSVAWAFPKRLTVLCSKGFFSRFPFLCSRGSPICFLTGRPRFLPEEPPYRSGFYRWSPSCSKPPFA